MLEEPDSKYQPRIALRSEGSLTLKVKVKVRTLYKHPFSHLFYERMRLLCGAEHISRTYGSRAAKYAPFRS